MVFLVKPFHRGFFCGDESIMLPYLDSTVSTLTLYLSGLIIPVLLIFLCEYDCVLSEVERIKKIKSSHRQCGIVLYCRNVFRKLLCFVSGVMYTFLIIAVAKFTVGRLRPNFIAVCGINIDSVCQNGTRRYVSNFTCPFGEVAADVGRISFPSDHAGFSFHAAVFTVLYLQKRWKFATPFWKPFLQSCIILLAWWVSLTRVMDNQHHLSDVMVGVFIGSGVAITNTIIVHSFFDYQKLVRDMGLNGVLSNAANSETKTSAMVLLQNRSDE